MLYTSIIGDKHRSTSERVLRWFQSQYLPRHHLDISLVYKNLESDGVFGWCMVEGSLSKPRTFLIEIHNKLDYKTYLTTLVHELWHVYQYVKGLPQCEEEAATMEKVLFNKLSCLNIQAS